MRKIAVALGLAGDARACFVADPGPSPSSPRTGPPYPGSRPATSTSGAGPSEFYRKHHAVEEPDISGRAFRSGWRVRTKLDKLFADGLIEPRVWQAAIAYRDLHSRAHAGMLGTIRLDGIRGGQSHYRGSRLERSEAQLAAIETLHRLGRELGEVATMLVELLIIQDLAWCKIAERFGIDPKTAKAWCLAALQRLSEVW